VTEWYECPHCQKVVMLSEGKEKKCSTCDATDGVALSHEQVVEGREAGTYFNIDPGTGKRAKKRR
jgi:phage FluMu protein Com